MREAGQVQAQGMLPGEAKASVVRLPLLLHGTHEQVLECAVLGALPGFSISGLGQTYEGSPSVAALEKGKTVQSASAGDHRQAT